MEEPIVNRVEESGLIQVDLGQLLTPRPTAAVDLAEWLDQGFVLREKAFRQQVSDWDASGLGGHVVAMHCSSDAILPDWAWMLVASRLQGIARSVHDCGPQDLEAAVLARIAEEIDPGEYQGQRLVIKGCGLKSGAGPAMRLVERLQPVVKSLMFGEPCSTVPVYKSR